MDFVEVSVFCIKPQQCLRHVLLCPGFPPPPVSGFTTYVNEYRGGLLSKYNL